MDSGGRRDSGWTCGRGGVPSNPRAPSGFAGPARYAFAFTCDEEEAGVERLNPIPENEAVEGPSKSGRVSEFGPVNASSRVSPLRERVIRSACLRFWNWGERRSAVIGSHAKAVSLTHTCTL